MKQALIQVLMATVGTLGFSILYNIRGKKLLLAGLGGMLSWSLYLILEPVIPSEVYRYFWSSVFVSVYSEILARRLKTPAATFLIVTLIPHIPGGSLYRTMRFALDRQWMNCLTSALYTFKLALALALGIVTVLTALNVTMRVKSWLRDQNKRSK